MSVLRPLFAYGTLQGLEQIHRAFEDEIHSPGINADVIRYERSYGCAKSIEIDEVDTDIAVVYERGRDLQTGGEQAAEGVNKHVDRLARMFGKCLGRHRRNRLRSKKTASPT